MSARQLSTSSRNSVWPQSCDHQHRAMSTHAERGYQPADHVSFVVINHDSRFFFHYCTDGFFDQHMRGVCVMVFRDWVLKVASRKKAITIIRKNASERLSEHIIALRRGARLWTKKEKKTHLHSGSCRLYQFTSTKHVFEPRCFGSHTRLEEEQEWTHRCVPCYSPCSVFNTSYVVKNSSSTPLYNGVVYNTNLDC